MTPLASRLRPVRLEDAPAVAELDTALTPDSPRDPAMLEFWWTHDMAEERWLRVLAEDGDKVTVFVTAVHGAWEEGKRHFGVMWPRMHPEAWSPAVYAEAVAEAESWMRDGGVETSVARVRDDFGPELEVLHGIGYVEERRQQIWRLDLVSGRDRLLATAERTRAEMARQGVSLLTLDQDDDEDRLRKLYVLDIETTEDIPKTAPWPVPTFDEWRIHWFDNPSHREDRFWIAREGAEIVGLSVIGYPPSARSLPWTSFTCTARLARGRGIARALKYASIEQAIQLGAREVETQNDAENVPILHLNEEMGYTSSRAMIELHRNLVP